MLFTTPEISGALVADLDRLDQMRARLGSESSRPVRWMGSLRRLARASTVESSTSIEGYHVPPGEALALVSGAETPDPSDDDRMAIASYAHAMEHVAVMADDPLFRWLDRVILDLHWDACSFQRDKVPGQWRTGPVAVTAGEGRIAYEGPPADDVPALMDEVVDWLEDGDLQAHVVVRAAMAHLHVVSVHPFRDGNGRISRIVQSLVLSRERLLAPEFASIEEYLGTHTTAYYDVLRSVQGGSYQPERDALPWVAFCIRAHIDQAEARLQQIEEAAARWQVLEQLVESRGWPDRLVIALEQSLIGGAERSTYGAEAEVSTATASADFRRLLDAGLVVQRGKTRSTRYVASDDLRELLGRAAVGAPVGEG